MVEKVKLSDIALEVGKTAKEVLELAKEVNIQAKATSSSVDIEVANAFVGYFMGEISKDELSQRFAPKQKTTKPKKASATKTIQKEEPEKNNSPKTQTIQEQPVIQKEEEESQQHLVRRTGIRIVKKSAPEVTETKTESKRTQYSIHDIFDEIKNEPKTLKPKKVKIKPLPVAHRHNEQKVNIDREIFDHSDDEEESNEIMLFDLNEQEVRDEEKERDNRQAMVDRIKVQKKAPWITDGSISRKRRKSNNNAKKSEEKVKQDFIVIPEEIRVYEFADLASLKLNEVVKVLFDLGMLVTKNDFLDSDAIEILCEEFKINFSLQKDAQSLEYVNDSSDGEENLVVRAPVVTIMGHVDHGKTSLLDRIRDTRIASGEAGGITQHIGAYSVMKNNQMISFIDTPGHEAFSEMRSRGAQVTDIAIIVIAADDGVKQQTIEAFNHAKAANVQIIIAMNKIDKENTNVDKLKAECAELGFTPNDWGGDYEFIGVSAKTGAGIDELLDTILIQAEILELRANPNRSAKAVVLESSMDKGRGAVATVIVQNGTLKVGDSVVADTTHGRVRALIDDTGRSVKELGPSGVAVVVGLGSVPSAGSILASVENDSIAREYATKRANYLRQKELSKSTKVSFDELSEMVAKGNLKSLPIIIKADTQGSLEAIRASLLKLNNHEVQINIIGSGVGGVSEGDISLAAASKNCLILGFNIRPTGVVKTKAKEIGIEIKTYHVIYALIDDVKALISGMMSPVYEEEHTGQAEVREVFSIAKVGSIAGCFVVDGAIQRGIKARLIRDGVVIHEGSISSLKRFKDDVKEVKNGYECGIMLENFNDIQVGDVFETYREVPKNVRL